MSVIAGIDGQNPSPSAAPTPEPTSLWRNPAFVRLWIAKTVSGIGSAVTGTAIPLTAVIVLGASAAQMALLVLATQLPDLFFGLVAGVWVDRVRRRPLLIGTDLGRAALLAIIPIAAFFHFLSFGILWFVAFACGSMTLIFTLASVSILPAIVKKEELVDANTKLQMSESVLNLIGPGAGGLLVQLVTAPKAILVDVGSFLASAWALGGVGTVEAKPARQSSGSALDDIWREIREGLDELMRTPLLRSLAISMGVIVVGGSVQQTVQILFYTRDLHLSAFEIGSLGACTGIGSLIGAPLSGRLSARFPIGMVMIVASLTGGVVLVIAAFAGSVRYPFAWLAVVWVLHGIGYAIFAITQISYRQRITPLHLMGRVTSSRRFLIFCMGIFGTALGAWTGTVLGFQASLVIAGVISLGGAMVMWFSPVRRAV